MKEEDGIGPSPPFKRCMMIREGNMGHSFMVRTLADSSHSSAVGCSSARGFPCSSRDESKADLKVQST